MDSPDVSSLPTQLVASATKSRPDGLTLSRLRVVVRQLQRHPLALVGLVLITGLVILALIPHLIAPYDPIKINMGERLRPPMAANWLGTDNFGRDIFSRIVYGARVSLLTGLSVIACAAVIGIAVGATAGYLGGWADEFLMRVTDIFMAFPVILLAMVIVVALRPGLANTAIALIIVWWPAYARLIRSQTLTLKERAYVEAATSVGVSPWRIVTRHILPNGITPLLVQATMDMGYVVLTAAGLGFLGLGAPPPTPEWGIMISNGRAYFLEAWWYPVFPGLAIATTVLAFNLLGDDLQDWLDPRGRRL